MKTLITAIAFVALAASPAFAGNGGAANVVRVSSFSQAAAAARSVANNHNTVSSNNANNNINNNSNSGVSNNTKFSDKLQPGATGLGGLAATGNCPMGSWNIAAGFPGGSLGFGSTIGHKTCHDLYLMQATHFSLAVQHQYVYDNEPSIKAAADKVAQQQPVRVSRRR